MSFLTIAATLKSLYSPAYLNTKVNAVDGRVVADDDIAAIDLTEAASRNLSQAIKARDLFYIAIALEIISAVGFMLSVPATGYVFVACLIAQTVSFAFLFLKMRTLQIPEESPDTADAPDGL